MKGFGGGGACRFAAFRITRFTSMHANSAACTTQTLHDFKRYRGDSNFYFIIIYYLDFHVDFFCMARVWVPASIPGLISQLIASWRSGRCSASACGRPNTPPIGVLTLVSTHVLHGGLVDVVRVLADVQTRRRLVF